jgi:type IV pilus assembly protein PilB
MGIEPFLVSSSVNLILAQRLVRRLCMKCRQEVTLHHETLREMGIDQSPEELTLFQPRGCVVCNETGYKGRLGIYEVMPITPGIREMIVDRVATADIKKEAVKNGMLTLRADGLDKFKRGETSLEEVLRETSAF